MSAIILEGTVRQTQAAFATVEEAAEFLRLGRTTIYQMMDAGTLKKATFPGVRAVRIPWANLRAIEAEAAQG
jgi:excisionase family DNA binding protein